MYKIIIYKQDSYYTFSMYLGTPKDIVTIYYGAA